MKTTKETTKIKDYGLAAVTPDNEGYLPIPGFNDYRIHLETMHLESCKGGKPWHEIWRKREQQNAHLRRKLADGTEETLRVSLGRLLFCATYGLDPTRVPKGIIFDNTGRPITLAEHNRRLLKSRRVDKKAITDSLKASRLYIDAVLEAYDTGDFSSVASLLAKYKDDVCSYLQRSLTIRNAAAREELWIEAYDAVLGRVKGCALTMASPLQYLKQTAKRIYQKQSSAKRRICHYDDFKSPTTTYKH